MFRDLCALGLFFVSPSSVAHVLIGLRIDILTGLVKFLTLAAEYAELWPHEVGVVLRPSDGCTSFVSRPSHRVYNFFLVHNMSPFGTSVRDLILLAGDGGFCFARRFYRAMCGDLSVEGQTASGRQGRLPMSFRMLRVRRCPAASRSHIILL